MDQRPLSPKVRAAMEAKTDDQVKAEIGDLVVQLRALFHDRDSRVVVGALVEMYARVASQCIESAEHLEGAITFFGRHVRLWWIAARGGPVRPC